MITIDVNVSIKYLNEELEYLKLCSLMDNFPNLYKIVFIFKILFKFDKSRKPSSSSILFCNVYLWK